MIGDLILGLSLLFGPFSDGQLRCLADNIYHEARGESVHGQLAVTHVVFNRTHSRKYPDNYCAVIHQGQKWNGHMVRDKCQFSWYCDGRSDVPEDKLAWNKAVKTAVIAWNTYYLSDMDMSDGATHYHSTTIYPYWADSMNQTITIDNHVFYNEG